jgi:hypothetical protein
MQAIIGLDAAEVPLLPSLFPPLDTALSREINAVNSRIVTDRVLLRRLCARISLS